MIRWVRSKGDDGAIEATPGDVGRDWGDCGWRCRDRERSDVVDLDDGQRPHDSPALVDRPGSRFEQLSEHGHRDHKFPIPLQHGHGEHKLPIPLRVSPAARPGLGWVVLSRVQRSGR